jgi:hypothetical protein
VLDPEANSRALSCTSLRLKHLHTCDLTAKVQYFESQVFELTICASVGEK